jgi:hypothetical protein
MRIRSHARSVRRSAFTLVEMLVATALVMMIMLIISQALAAASKTTSALRTAGVLQERNRTAITLMRKDLGGDKFGPPYGSARGGPRLSDQRLDQSGWTPANSGYFEMRQLGEGPAGNLASILEPFANARTDGEGITSTRAVNHKMRFTVRLPDGPQTDLFAAQFLSTFTADSRVNSFINAQSIMYTRWAEVVYWLEPTVGEFASGGLQLYSLRRRIRLLPPTSVDYNNLPLAQAMQLVGSYYVSYPNVPKYPDVIAPIIVTPNPIPAQPSRSGSFEQSRRRLDTDVCRQHETAAVRAANVGDSAPVLDRGRRSDDRRRRRANGRVVVRHQARLVQQRDVQHRGAEQLAAAGDFRHGQHGRAVLGHLLEFGVDAGPGPRVRHGPADNPRRPAFRAH